MDKQSFIDPALLALNTQHIPRVDNKKKTKTKGQIEYRIFNSDDEVISLYKRPRHNLGKTSRVRSVINANQMPTAVFKCPLPDCMDFTIGTELATVYNHLDDLSTVLHLPAETTWYYAPTIAAMAPSISTISGCTTCPSAPPSTRTNSTLNIDTTALTA